MKANNNPGRIKMSSLAFLGVGYATPGVAFLLTLVFGFWLGNKGKPYNGLLFNIHKLIALATVIITAMRIYSALKNTGTQALLMTLIVLTAICVIALFASGAFLSIGNLDYGMMKRIHNIAPVLAIMTMGLTIYLLATGAG